MKILKSVVKRVIGDHHLLRLRRAAKRLKHFGLVRFCPCCKARLRRFIPFGLIKRPEAKCAVCESLERHRLMWLYGLDYKDRLMQAGFSVTVDDFVRKLDNRTVRRFGLMRDEDVYFCRKKAT
jgi:hypothetical protein